MLFTKKQKTGLARAFAALDSEPTRSVKVWEEPLVPKNIFSAGLALGDVPVVEVARQLTLADWELYGKITSPELLSLGWLSQEHALRAPRVTQLLRRFAAVEAWTRGSVLQEEQRGNQGSHDVIGYFVSLAKALLEMRSFHSAAAVWGGLSSEPVWRIRSTMTQEQKSSTAVLEQTLSCWRGFSAYKKILAELPPDTPCVPLLPVHAQSLALCMHASPTRVGSCVNMTKFAGLHRLLEEFLAPQKTRYPFLFVAQIQSFVRTEKLAFFLD